MISHHPFTPQTTKIHGWAEKEEPAVLGCNSEVGSLPRPDGNKDSISGLSEHWKPWQPAAWQLPRVSPAVAWNGLCAEGMQWSLRYGWHL